MSRLHRLADGGEVARRRKLAPPGSVIEAWPDLYAPGSCWLGDESKTLLDGLGPPVPATLSVDGSRVPVYYGPRLCDEASLPTEGSLRARVLSAHGVAVVWITLDGRGERTEYQPQAPEDPVFYLRRPRAIASHVWRLFRTRDEAAAYMREHYWRDPAAHAWALALPARDFQELVEPHGDRG